MTIAMEPLNRGWSLGFAASKVQAVRAKLQRRYRHWRRYRTMLAELDQYSPEQLTELGIADADIAHIAGAAARRIELTNAADHYGGNQRHCV